MEILLMSEDVAMTGWPLQFMAFINIANGAVTSGIPVPDHRLP